MRDKLVTLDYYRLLLERCTIQQIFRVTRILTHLPLLSFFRCIRFIRRFNYTLISGLPYQSSCRLQESIILRVYQLPPTFWNFVIKFSTHITYTHFSKAFDRVERALLVYKLLRLAFWKIVLLNAITISIKYVLLNFRHSWEISFEYIDAPENSLLLILLSWLCLCVRWISGNVRSCDLCLIICWLRFRVGDHTHENVSGFKNVGTLCDSS